MIPLRVLTLIVTRPNQPSVLVLEAVEESPEGKTRVIPIWIGPNEAAQISLAIENVHPARPLTHDLFLDAITNLDARVDHVVIHEVRKQTFYAHLFLTQGGRLIELDARPSDALALAIRQGAPFYADEEVLEKASFPHLFKPHLNPEEEMAEFKTFLEDLTPEDFEA